MSDLADQQDQAALAGAPADDGGHVVARGYDVEWQGDDEDDDTFFDARLPELQSHNEAARSLAPSLVGLTVEQAQDLVNLHPNLSVAFTFPGQGHPAVGVFGQISAVVEEGVIASAE